MANYTTNLKLWGSIGQEYPDGYSYEEGEQPVDEWDNFFQYNAQQDIDHLIQLTNDRLESERTTTAPTSPEPGHIYYDSDAGTLHWYDDVDSEWNEIFPTSGGSIAGDLVAADGEIIWDESAGYIPQERLENDSLTVTAGDGLKNGGLVSLGGSTTVNIEPSDFAGHGLEDDGTDNLRIDGADLGAGIAGGDGTNLSFDESVIKDGGVKEIDAQEFSGANGANGEVLSTDGANAFWSSPPTSVEASETNDGSDLTNYTFSDYQNGTTSVIDVTGSGTLIGGVAISGLSTADSPNSFQCRITVDGGTEYSIDCGVGETNQGYGVAILEIPAVKFESSLGVDLHHEYGSDIGMSAVVKQ